LASALLALEPVVVDQRGIDRQERADLAAFPVDVGWHVAVDPEVLVATDVPTIGFWLVHQTSHLLRHHDDRSPSASAASPRGPDQVRWNVAADLEINDDLVAGEVRPPDDAARPSQFGLDDGLTAESYFDLLGGSEEDSGPTGSTGDCGSGCDGLPRPWDGDGAGGVSGMHRRLLEQHVAHEIRKRQEGRGDVPAGWVRWADDLLEPTVDWRRALAAAVRRGLADVAGRVDFTYRKPSRRSSVSPGVVLPSLRQPKPNVAMVIDTSGSMDDRMLSQCLAEVGGVLAGLGVARHQLRVVCCDADAYEAQRVVAARDVTLLGGGGTDMGVGLRAVAELRPRPDLVIVLTDGMTPWPTAPPRGIEVVVGLLGGFGTAPSWARSIAIDRAA
jgi:predicted metal-dependent peptidase